MLTTIFLGGGTSLGVSLPSRFPGEERVLSIIPSLPPPHPLPISDWKASYCIVVTMENAGGGGGGPLECDPIFFAKGYSMLSLFLTILCFVNRNCERGEPSNRWAKKGKTQVRLLVFHPCVCKPNLEKSQPIRIKKKCYNERMRSLSKLQKCLKTRVTSKQLDRIKCQVSLTSYQVKWIKTNTVLFNNAFDTWWNISIGYNMILTTLTHFQCEKFI